MNQDVPPLDRAAIERGLRAAFDLMRSGRLDEAEISIRRLQQAAPIVAVSLLACDIAEAKSGPRAALEVLAAAIARHGARGDLLLRRAQLLVPLMERAEAVQTARQAAAASPGDPRILQGAASVIMVHGDPAEAKPLLQRLCELLPGHPAALYETALCLFYLNETDTAAQLLDQVLSLAPGMGTAMHVRAHLRTQSQEANHVEDLRQRLQRTDLALNDRILANFALAKELEDVGRHAESFAALATANRLKRGTLQFDVDDEVQAMQEVMATYTREALAGIPDGCPESGPIFIVGLPRTGTTLVERILATGPDTASIGEAMEFPQKMIALAEETAARQPVAGENLLQASLRMDFAELGRRYLDAVRPMARGRSRTIDKLPFNFRYCGLIHKALPNARIVHLMRDPMDTCYAVYKTVFINMYHFSYRLDELAEFYVAYRRTMDHWHRVLPGVIYDVSYERLVADPEGEARRLLEWCGLPWHAGALDFHRSAAASTTASSAQVRKPIYRSSVAKWRNVADQMQPVLQRLAAAGLVDAEGNALPR
ncbi:MAG TPA: sulfotransferase [Steroidobacteraceae bacterium]